MCGEHPLGECIAYAPQGSSPHVRGARRKSPCRCPCTGIIPACAGSTFVVSRKILSARDHPRMCGEHVMPTAMAGHRIGIIPACAGSTHSKPTTRWSTRDHPRMCGEHRQLPQVPPQRAGSSPHVRGAQQPTLPRIEMHGIIPACAGSTLRK